MAQIEGLVEAQIGGVWLDLLLVVLNVFSKFLILRLLVVLYIYIYIEERGGENFHKIFLMAQFQINS